MRDQQGRAALSRLATQIEAIIAKADGEGREHFTSAELEKYRKLEAAFDSQQAAIEAREGNGDINGAGAGPFRNGRQPISDSGDVPQIRDTYRGRSRRSDPHARAFTTYLRAGVEGLDEGQRGVMRDSWRGIEDGARILNAQSIGTGSQGGYAVPQGFSYDLMEAEKFFGGIVGVAGEFDTASGNTTPWPTVNDVTNKGRLIGENAQNVETDLVFGTVTFTSYIGSSDIVLVPLTLISDSAFGIDRLLAKLLGERLGRLKNYYCTVGTGTNQPTGLVNATVTAGNSMQLTTGNTASIGYNNLVDLEHLVDPAYRAHESCCFMLSDAMLKLLKKLVDGNNRPLWQPGLTASFREGAAVQLDTPRPTILGYKFVVNSDMATPAANAYTIAFGAMDCFKVRKVAPGVTVMRLTERYADYLQQGFIAFERFDSNLIDAGTHPIALLQQSAT
jgi:HK97 family phage major capsid protein